MPLESFISTHPILGPLGFIVARTICVLIPWLPAFTIDVPGLLIFGLFPGFFYAEIGIITGASIAFWIARLFKHELIHFFPSLASLESTEEWSQKKTLLTVFLMRISTLPFFDYVAGFLHISFKNFFIATVFGSIGPTFVFYYFGDKAFEIDTWYGRMFIEVVILSTIVMWVIHKKKNGKSSQKEVREE